MGTASKGRRKVEPLPYYGGKARGRGAWIASLLPWEYRSLYWEPFCGMAGVWAQRDRVRSEILNDLNERAINWWRVVRDHLDEFGMLLEATPYARREYEWAIANLDNQAIGPVRRALAFHVAIHQSVVRSDSKFAWGVALNIRTGSRGIWRYDRVAALAERLRQVQLECRDALELLDRYAEIPHAVCYVDPPYRSANTEGYRFPEVDQELLTKLLHAQHGRVAVSGYGEEWDHLGWQRHEKIVPFRGYYTTRRTLAAPGPRTEVLWTNYRPRAA